MPRIASEPTVVEREFKLLHAGVCQYKWYEKGDMRHCTCAVRKVLTEVVVLRAKLERVQRAYFSEAHEIDQILGKALGYPAADESIMPEPDGSVVTGEHTPVTLAMEAAKKLKEANWRQASD